MPHPQDTLVFLIRDQAGGSVEARFGSDDLLRFSAGEISRAQALRSLGISYSELLDRLSRRALALPRVSDLEAEAMASTVTELLVTSAR